MQQGKSQWGNWKRQDVMVEQNDGFKRPLCLCIWDNKLLQHTLKVGQQVSFEVFLESKNYNQKWYTQIVIKQIITIIEPVQPSSDFISDSIPAEEDDGDFLIDVDDQKDFYEYDNDEPTYSKQEIDNMYLAAFENDLSWEWNID